MRRRQNMSLGLRAEKLSLPVGVCASCVPQCVKSTPSYGGVSNPKHICVLQYSFHAVGYKTILSQIIPIYILTPILTGNDDVLMGSSYSCLYLYVYTCLIP
jgi:hypothetical protein